MTGDRIDRLTRIADAVQAVQGEDPAGDLCEACVGLLAVSGCSMTVVTDGVASLLSASDPIASYLEELQVTLGEGPSVEAHETGRPISEPNLDRPRRERWIAFAPAALETGARALFSFPLRLGGVRLGALTLYENTAGSLTDDQHSDAIEISNLATTAILMMQAESSTDALSPHLEMLAVNNAVLHQASGMVSVQLDVGVGEALIRIRAHAFAVQSPLGEVTKDIVARRLRLEP
jgi:hypothetical protein